MIVVISQPMFFPWIGMLEQVRLADVYVNYGDVQFSKGSFVNRVQVKTAAGPHWLTVPLAGLHLGQHIDDVRINAAKDWRRQHLELLRQAYAGAPHADEMLALVEGVYAMPCDSLGALAQASLLALCRYYSLDAGRRFVDVADLGIGGSSSRRVLDVVKSLGGTRYVTGWGARQYLDHALFEAEGVTVEYMDYAKTPYPQRHGAFTPYVSALDLVANLGRAGAALIHSGTVHWKDFVAHG